LVLSAADAASDTMPVFCGLRRKTRSVEHYEREDNDVRGYMEWQCSKVTILGNP